MAFKEQKRPRHRGLRLFVLIVLVLAIAFGIFGVLSRQHKSHTLKQETEASSILSVNVIKPSQLSVGGEIVLPGTVRAWHEASLSARVSGYLKNWYKDIGDHVHAGDILADIDTPETDAQLHQAEADLSLAIANNNLAQTTAQRWLALLKTDSVTHQETDEKVADASAKAASVQSSAANRDRLRDLEAFKNIMAPFDGVVTARSTDIGALINQNGSEIYHIASTDRLRVYVNVPENDASALTARSVAMLHFNEHPGQSFAAMLLSTAGAIDPASRTLLAQFVLANPNGVLFPGGYCEVHLISPDAAKSLRLPANAFLFRAQGLQLAVVNADHKIELRDVKPGRDFGTSIEVLSGISSDDNVVVNPADSLYQGETVRIAPATKPDGGREQQQAENQKAQDGQTSDKDQSGQSKDSASADSKDSDTKNDNNKAGGSEKKKEAKSKDPNVRDDAQK